MFRGIVDEDDSIKLTKENATVVPQTWLICIKS